MIPRTILSSFVVSAAAVTAQASSLGLVATSAGNALWDTFTSSTGYPTVTIASAAPTSFDDSAFTATLSASMPGTVTGSGERIYSGTGANGNPFGLTLDIVASASFDTLTLQLKATGPLQNVPLEDNIVPAGEHFSVSGDGSWSAPTRTYLGSIIEGSNTFYIYAWTWTDLGVSASDTFSLHITSADGHVSLDAFRLDAAAVPEPSAFAALAGLGALACAATRRRRR